MHVRCPNCCWNYEVPDSAGGRKATCVRTGCNTKFVVPVPEPTELVFEDDDESPPPHPTESKTTANESDGTAAATGLIGALLTFWIADAAFDDLTGK